MNLLGKGGEGRRVKRHVALSLWRDFCDLPVVERCVKDWHVHISTIEQCKDDFMIVLKIPDLIYSPCYCPLSSQIETR